MDLTRQPPRRPSNTGMAGIAGLARMADKARGHKAELIGEFKYGEDSGLDREVLALIGVSAADFADAAETLWDAELADWVRDRMSCTAEEIEAFDEEQTTRRPQDDLHRRLLKERVAKYAPGSTGVTTVYASIELDDWGAFRDQDLTARPPRSGYVRSVLGLVAAARMADKARAHRAGRMGDYRYGDDSFFDRTLLELLGLTAADFEEGAWRNPNDTELGEWILGRVEAPRPGAVSALNARLARHGEAHPEWRERFGQRRDEICPERKDVTTYFELQDIDDQACFGLVDLNRRAPRSPYDTSLGGVHCLARMVDKGRAHNAGLLGGYWFGEDSGFDRRLLEHLGLSQEEFAAGLKEHAGDEAVLAWLGDRVGGEQEVAAINATLRGLAPSSDRMQGFLTRAVRGLDPGRWDVNSFMALTELDDEITFARLRARI